MKAVIKEDNTYGVPYFVSFTKMQIRQHVILAAVSVKTQSIFKARVCVFPKVPFWLSHVEMELCFRLPAMQESHLPHTLFLLTWPGLCEA